MYRATTWLLAGNLFLALMISGCTGGCSCADPYPPGVVMPENLILENGIQIRITEQGFDFIEQNMGAIVASMLGSGLCLPPGNFSFLISIDYCDGNGGEYNPLPSDTCSDGSVGCQMNLDINTIDFTLNAPNEIDVYIDLSFDIHFRFTVDEGFLGDFSCVSDCDMGGGSPACSTPAGRGNTLHGDNIMITVTMALNNDAATRYLDMEVTDLNIGSLNIDIGSFTETDGCSLCIGGCGTVEVIGDLITGLVGLLAPLLDSLLAPIFGDMVAGFVPDPPGMEGVMDMSATLGFPPAGGIPALMEISEIAGGDPGMGDAASPFMPKFVTPDPTSGAAGLVLGMRSATNSDITIADMDGRSTPHPCVPARTFAFPNEVGTIPAGVARTLPFAAEFTMDTIPGVMAGYDIGIGIAEAVLDAGAFNLFNSGGLCIAIGSNTIDLIDTGTFGLLIPSLGELTHGVTSPMLLALRPLEPPEVTIGVGAAVDPNDKLIQIFMPDLAIDMYAFIEERYVRIFTMTVNLGLALDLDVMMNCPPGGGPCVTELVPVFDSSDIYFGGGCGIGGANPCVTNNELLKEDPTELEALLPTLIGLAAPFIAGAIDPIPLPDFNGFLLNIPVGGITRVVGNLPGGATHNFLAIFATLDFDPALAGMFSYDLETIADIGETILPPAGTWAAEAKLAAEGADDAIKPSIEMTVDAEGGPAGAEYEWQYRVDGGFWSKLIRERTHAITDSVFWLQGRHVVEIRTRVVGDPASYDRTPDAFEVLIDNEPPRVHLRWDDDAEVLHIEPRDGVTAAESLSIEVRYDDGSASVLTPAADVALSADVEGRVPVVLVVTDEAGNTSTRTIDPATHGFHENTPAGGGGGGCGCGIVGVTDSAASSPRHTAMFLAALLLSLALLRRRRSAASASPSAQPPRRTGRGFAHASGLLLTLLIVAVVFAGGFAGCAGCCGNDPANCEDECGEEGGTYDEKTGECICNSTTCKTDLDCADVMCLSGIPYCNPMTQMCDCYPLVAAARPGRYSEVGVSSATAFISAYSDSLGDLMVGTLSASTGGTDRPITCTGDSECPVGRPCNVDRDYDLLPDTCAPEIDWVYVDGVPDLPPSSDPAGERGGITEAGEDVGLYTSIAMTTAGNPAASYYDLTNGDLKYAYSDGAAWNVTVVDSGIGFGADVGRYTSLTLDASGAPGIAYYAGSVDDGSGNEVTQARFAQASTANPSGPSDWAIYILDEAPAVPDDPKSSLVFLPMGVGLFNSAARLSGDIPAVAFYDRLTTTVKLSVFDPGQGAFLIPTTLDGGLDMAGDDIGDMGQWVSLAIDSGDNFHLSYVDATMDDLVYLYVEAGTGAMTREVVDDGIRSELAVTGEMVPVFALVGEDSSIVLDGDVPGIVYQDATFLDLMYASRDASVPADPVAAWVATVLVGNDPKFYLGAVGFYADQVLDGGAAIITTWTIDSTLDPRYTGMLVMNRAFSAL